MVLARGNYEIGIGDGDWYLGAEWYCRGDQHGEGFCCEIHLSFLSEQ